MKDKSSRKRGGGKAGGGGGGKSRKKVPLDEDSFFDQRKRRKYGGDEDEDGGEIYSDDSFEDGDFDAGQDGEPEEDEFEKETADEKRQRVAKATLEQFRAMAEREQADKDEDDDDDDEGEREGLRDSMVSKLLQQEQLEEMGRSRRMIASGVQRPETGDAFRVLVKHPQSVTAVALSDEDSRGFSASKDGTIFHWDVATGNRELYKWPSDEILRSHGMKDPQGRASKQSKNILALAASSDGRYLATGGLDRHIHLWDTRTREHIQAFPGHKGPVSCLTFRQGTAELFSGSFDRTIKIWNCDDRVYINTLFGHQGEVLAIDCLRKERVLAVGRDRTMQLFKVPEESRVVFRAPASSLECCCFISNSDYLSGSDDGSIELWSMLRKKPVSIVKNAHPSAATTNQGNVGLSPNGHIAENGGNNHGESKLLTANSWVSSVCVCRGSDLAASGAGNGYVRLWNLGSEPSKEVRPLFDLPLAGFVNSLAIAKSGKFIVAGVGQEPRLGRWGRVSGVRNGVAIHSLKLVAES